MTQKGRTPEQIYRFTFYRESGVMIFESRYYAQKYINEVLRKNPENYWTSFTVEKDENDGYLISERSYVKIPQWMPLTEEWKNGK